MELRNEVTSEVWSDNFQINWSRVFNKDDVAFSYIIKLKSLLLKSLFKSYGLKKNILQNTKTALLCSVPSSVPDNKDTILSSCQSLLGHQGCRYQQEEEPVAQLHRSPANTNRYDRKDSTQPQRLILS